jgi:hypothetical protein
VILSELKDYIQQRGQVSLQDIALHFDADADALRGMLERWIRKGLVSRRSATASCGSSCSQCDPAAVELYVWDAGSVDAPAAQPLLRDLGCSKR